MRRRKTTEISQFQQVLGSWWCRPQTLASLEVSEKESQLGLQISTGQSELQSETCVLRGRRGKGRKRREERERETKKERKRWGGEKGRRKR